jgi:hypothetical protein
MTSSLRTMWIVSKPMQTVWRGKQNKIRPSKIKEKNGYLGLHSPMLQLGDIWHMGFQETNAGTDYLLYL